mgnify:CR=1 FL=1
MAVHLEFVVPGPPVSHQQKSPQGKWGLRSWKAAIEEMARRSWTSPSLRGPLKVVVINFYDVDNPTIDIDNMAKPIFDALEGVVYVNDRQIRQAEIAHLEIDAPFTVAGAARIIVDALREGERFVYVRVEDPVVPYPLPRWLMISQDQLESVASRYREQGYRVVLHPGPDVLPDFAKDFKVEILAERGNRGVLASVKETLADVARDDDLPRYAEAIDQRPNWRYDLSVLGPMPTVTREPQAEEASDEEIAKALDDADRLLDAGFPPLAIISAWAATEAAMRRRLRSLGEKADWWTTARPLLDGLFAAGEFSFTELRELERLDRLRDVVVRGFATPDVGRDDVETLRQTARRLIEESSQVEAAS